MADFLHAGIFLWGAKIMFSNPGSQTKMGRAMGILLISRFSSDSTKNLEINKIHIARPIFAWEPGLLNIILKPHKNMPACKKSAIYLKYWANYILFIFFLEVSEIQWGARFPIPLTTPIPTPYLLYLPHTIPTPFLPHTYPIPTHTYKNQPITYPIPNLL